MTNPSTPNFDGSAGRLSTDRFDFEDHINGVQFRHQAGSIDMYPSVIIDGYDGYTVQGSIELLAGLIAAPVIPDATSTVKGIVKLTGDFGGTSAIPTVTGLRGYPVSTLPPVIGEVLTWNGSAWETSASSNSFAAGGDLIGTSTSQQVVNITGDVPAGGGVSHILASSLIFNKDAHPSITQATQTTGNATSMAIYAQSASAASANGGSVLISGGNRGTGGLAGGVLLSCKFGATPMLHASNIAAGQNILSLLSTIDTSVMPANTGDRVIYIADAVTDPTSGSPVDGSILYSSSGKMRVKQEDGVDFIIGSIPNPSTWGDTGQQTVTYRTYTTATTTAINALTIPLQDNTYTKVDVLFTYKIVGAAQAGSISLSAGIVRDAAAAPVAVGSPVSTDARATGVIGTGPGINISGNNLLVTTGADPYLTTKWLIVTQLTMSQG